MNRQELAIAALNVMGPFSVRTVQLPSIDRQVNYLAFLLARLKDRIFSRRTISIDPELSYIAERFQEVRKSAPAPFNYHNFAFPWAN